MRTTVTLDPDVAALLKKRMKERGMGFKQALNDALRSGLTEPRKRSKPFRTRTFNMGFPPNVNLDKALQLAGQLEDEELIRKMQLGK
ncbi:MAG: antitoxin [Acidimicrobiales bacterium]